MKKFYVVYAMPRMINNVLVSYIDSDVIESNEDLTKNWANTEYILRSGEYNHDVSAVLVVSEIKE